MDNQTMGPRNVGFVLSEASGGRSRDTIVIASGAGILEPGTILGKITASDKYEASPDVDVNGSGVAVAVLAYRTDATAADADAVIFSRDAEVKIVPLQYEASVNDTAKQLTKHDQLAAVGIIVR